MIKPILFNTKMVQAILEGRKTTTRRIIKDVEPFGKALATPKGIFSKEGLARHGAYHIGDILYVRETWQEWTGGYAYKVGGDYPQSFIDKWRPSIHMPKEAARLFLRVTDIRVEILHDIDDEGAFSEGVSPWDERCYESNGWNPTFSDPDSGGICEPIEAFKAIWNRTVNKKDIDKYGWNANPWVWVIEFERIEKSEVEQ